MSSFFEHLIHEFHFPLSNPVLVFALILLIILLSPILLKRLNIPGIIGLIISGVIIGPHGFNILEKNSAAELFSTIGLLYIMFIAGLELDILEFKINRRKSILFGLLTFTIPMFAGFYSANIFGGYDFNASLLIGSMLATHTLVAYPIVSRLGLSKKSYVSITVGGTIIADTLVLLILAVILGNSDGKITSDFWINYILSLSIFAFIMFYLIPKISKWFFAKLEGEKYLHYIYVLFVVFFGAFLSEVAGLEPIIGAFFAGLALNKLIPQSSALMSRIEFIGNSLFIPFFLISVGMLVEIQAILSGYTTLLISAILIIVALGSKWIPAYIIQKIFHFKSSERNLIFGLSSARVAATLAVVLVGFNAGIIGENILNGTIILILVSSIVSSIVTDNAAKKLLSESEDGIDDANQLAKNYDEHILVPIANMQNVEKLIEFAILLKDKKSNNPLTMLTVVPNNEQAELNLLKSKNKLEKVVEQCAAAEIEMNTVVTIDHSSIDGINRVTREVLANIMIIGWPRRSGIIEKLFGEKIDAIIRTIDKNIFVCNIEKPLINHQKLILFTPELAEKESGFMVWVRKVTLLALELGLPIIHYGDSKTHEAINKVHEFYKISSSLSFKEFSNFADVEELKNQIMPSDLIVLSSSRVGSVSYQTILENLPSRMARIYEDNNIIAVYPQQFTSHFSTVYYDDFTTNPVARGMNQLDKIRKSVANILNK